MRTARRGFRAFSVLGAIGLIAAVVALVAAFGSRFHAPISGQPVAFPALVEPAPGVHPLTAPAPKPDPAAVRAAIAPFVSAPELGTFAGSVSDAITGEVLWSRDAAKAATPASTMKILTATTALLSLPVDHRVPTTVVRGASAGEIVLVGAGDPTLSAAAEGERTFYSGAARLDDLAEQVEAANIDATGLRVDVSAYSGTDSAPGWSDGDVAGGYIAPMKPVMVDGARLSDDLDAPRSATPALDAGRALASRLGLSEDSVRLGTAPEGAEKIAEVWSAPLRTRLTEMLGNSDNVLAEAVGREAAAALGHPASFEGVATAIRQKVSDLGLETAGSVIRDASGLSIQDRLSAKLLDQIMTRAAGPNEPRLRPMLDDLPVAGGTGTLSSRYGGSQKAAAGWVRAKTGTLSTVSALVGYVVDQTGRVLTFAMLSNGEPPDVARPAIDDVVLALRSCGCP